MYVLCCIAQKVNFKNLMDLPDLALQFSPQRPEIMVIWGWEMAVPFEASDLYSISTIKALRHFPVNLHSPNTTTPSSSPALLSPRPLKNKKRYDKLSHTLSIYNLPYLV